MSDAIASSRTSRHTSAYVQSIFVKNDIFLTVNEALII